MPWTKGLQLQPSAGLHHRYLTPEAQLLDPAVPVIGSLLALAMAHGLWQTTDSLLEGALQGQRLVNIKVWKGQLTKKFMQTLQY